MKNYHSPYFYRYIPVLVVLAAFLLSTSVHAQGKRIALEETLQRMSLKQGIVFLIEGDIEPLALDVSKSPGDIDLKTLIRLLSENGGYRAIPLGKLCLLRKNYGVLKTAVPDVSLREAFSSLRTLIQISGPLRSGIQDENAHKRQLAQLFDINPSVERLELPTYPEGSRIRQRVIEEVILPVQNLSQEQKLLVWRSSLHFYTDQAFENLEYPAKRLGFFLQEKPSFCFQDFSGLHIFGYTTSRNPPPAGKLDPLFIPLSHPGQISRFKDDFAVAYVTQNGKPVVYSDETEPTVTDRNLLSSLRAITLESLIARSGHEERVLLAEEVKMKRVTCIGDLPAILGGNTARSLADSLGKLFDLTVTPSGERAFQVAPKKKASLRGKISNLPQVVESVLPATLVRAVRERSAPGIREALKTPQDTEWEAVLIKREHLSRAILQMSHLAVRRLRVLTEPDIANASQGRLPFRIRDAEVGNLVALIELLSTLNRLLHIVDQPVPEFIQQFDKVVLKKSIAPASDGKLWMDLAICIRLENGEIGLGPGYGFPVPTQPVDPH